MILYIVRHAIAVPHGTPGISDEDRPLTDAGVKKMREAAAGMHVLNYVPDRILCSPLLRARQTADILLEEFGKAVELKITDSLAPSGRRQGLYREISSLAGKAKSLMLVGHQPSLGEIAGDLVWGSPEHYIEFKKGGACAIEMERMGDAPRGRMIALLTPSILREIAR